MNAKLERRIVGLNKFVGTSTVDMLVYVQSGIFPIKIGIVRI
jgi:hypothetical protein